MLMKIQCPVQSQVSLSPRNRRLIRVPHPTGDSALHPSRLDFDTVCDVTTRTRARTQNEYDVYQWEPSCSMRTDGRMNLIGAFRNFENTPKTTKAQGKTRVNTVPTKVTL